jgi:hypothetical protein
VPSGWKAQESDFLPVYRRLEGFFELIVANAQHMKAVPGRKTDVQDADWIADAVRSMGYSPPVLFPVKNSKTSEI